MDEEYDESAPLDRRQVVVLIRDTVDSGEALYKACAELGISKRTYNAPVCSI